MAVCDADSGAVYNPPLSATDGLSLPLLVFPNSVGRDADLEYRRDSQLMIIKAAPHWDRPNAQSYSFYFLLQDKQWKLLRRVPITDERRNSDDDENRQPILCVGFPRFLRIESPRISMRCALWTRRSRMPSASVGSPICSCHRETGSCEVRIVERAWHRSSQISQKSRRSSSDNGAIAQSSITRT
jgi:hypothetical protein